MKTIKEICLYQQQNALNGVKLPHSMSQPVIYKRDKRYYLACFVFFFSKEDIDSGTVNRPTFWIVANIENGEIIYRYETVDMDFSDASYDAKYNVRSDERYNTSKEYYDRAFEILDEVRRVLIERGIFLKKEYRKYLNMIVANIPREYQRFYYDLSVRIDDEPNGKEDENMEVDKNVSGENDVQDEKRDASQPPKELDDTPKPTPEDSVQTIKDDENETDDSEAVLKAIKELQKTFREKLFADQHKDQLIDKLHDEVVQYRNGVVNKVVDTMAIDIIQLADNVRKIRAAYSEKEANAENFTKLLRVVKGLYEDLQDILYRQGIEPYTVDGHDVDARRQTIIASVPTDDERKHNKIAVRTAEGYEREDGSVLRRERVKIFKYQSETKNDGK